MNEKLLILSPDRFVGALIEGSIRAHPDWSDISLDRVASIHTALQDISKTDYHLAIVDCDSFNESPLEILIQLRSQKKVPLILINRPGMEKTAIACLKHGADYYLIKDKNWEDHLPAVIETVLEEKQQKDRVKKKLAHLEGENAKLKKESILDQTTLFYSAPHFNTVLARELKRAARYDIKVSCMVVEVGLEEMRHDFDEETFFEKLALALRSVGRSSDIWARITEKRFAALLPHTTAAQARKTLKRIQSELTTVIKTREAPKLQLRWGLSSFDKKKIKSEHDFINQAVHNLN